MEEEESDTPQNEIFTTPQQYSGRYQVIKKKLDSQKFMRFGLAQLPVLELDNPSAFRPMEGLPVDPQQRTLLNSLWKAKTKEAKHQALNALQYYFAKLMTPPMGKSYAFYSLVRGPKKGIYYHYPSLCEVVGNRRNCHWRGFYSFQEAYDFLLKHCDEEERIFIEKEGHGALSFSLEQEITELKNVLSEERKELNRLQTILAQ